jgi:hypothetical protein
VFGFQRWCTGSAGAGTGISIIRPWAVRRIGARATERELKGLSDSGELARYRVVHFATHGAMAGQLNKDFEPGLILTPPAEASETDDGYLSASEIAGLKLDADWVILSACNTAAGQATSAEALSGLARAFIYAHPSRRKPARWHDDGEDQAPVAPGRRRIAGLLRAASAAKNPGRTAGPCLHPPEDWLYIYYPTRKYLSAGLRAVIQALRA